MKFLCPECERLISLEQFRFDGAALVVTCQKCGVEARVTRPLTYLTQTP